MSAAKETVKLLFRYRFGTAEFDEARFELSVAGMKIEIQRRPLEVLALLLTHAGEVVTKEELIANVWEGRPTVENVIANALTKLRHALGEDNATQIVTLPRVGYRFAGPLQRISVGQTEVSSLELRPGDLAPLRKSFQLKSLLSASRNSELWLACHLETGEPRVFKYAPDGERLSALKREVTLSRLLQESLGARDDLVRILDWNFETVPFFIECEYGGESLQAWAESPAALKALTLMQRIDLFLQIATVVAVAHDVGVLHKDLRPTNVLVVPQGDRWQIRLTDFGSGSVLNAQRLADLGITQLGLTITSSDRSDDTGTLLYLAPELIVQHTSTIQSDVYALGVMLYQVLVGDLRSPMTFGWERDIEDDLLRDDIRAATEGNPAHRLNSVHTLIERLRTLDERRHHLQQEQQSQIVADQARAAIRRAQLRRPWMIAAGVAGILCLMGFAASSWLYMRAIRVQHQLLQSQAQASRQAARAEAINDFWNDEILGAANPLGPANTSQRTIKEVMASAANNLDGKFNDDPLTEAAIRTKLGTIFTNMADGATAELQLQRSVAVLSQAGGFALPQLLKSRYALALALLAQSKFDQAASELADTDDVRLKHGVNDIQTLEASHLAWGQYFYRQEQIEFAIPHFEEGLRLLGTHSEPNRYLINCVRGWLGDAYISVNRLKDAEQILREVLDSDERHHASELTLAVDMGLYGASLLYQHQYRAAGPFIEQSYQTTAALLGRKHRRTIDSLALRCDLYSLSDQREKTLQCRQEVYEITRANNGEHHWSTFSALVDLGGAQYALGRYSEAAHSLETATPALARSRGTDKYVTQIANYYLARCLIQLHRSIDHAQLLIQPLDPKVLVTGEPDAPWTLRIQLLRGMVLLSQGKRSEALALLQPASQLHDDADPTDNILQEARQLLNNPHTTNNDEHLAGIQ